MCDELIVGKFDPYSDEVAITQDGSVIAHVYGCDAGKVKALALDFVLGRERAIKAEAERDASQAREAVMREAWNRAGDLLPYTIHRADCRHHDIGPGNCSCGLLDVVRDYGRAALAAGQGDGQG